MKKIYLSCKQFILKIIALFMGKQSIEKFLRYLFVGFSSFILEYAIFYCLFKVLSMNEIIANTTALLTVFFYNFLMNRLWTFKSKEKAHKQVVLYGMLFLFNMIISNLFIYGATHYFSISPLLSKVIIMAMIVIWNFIIYRKIIYKS